MSGKYQLLADHLSLTERVYITLRKMILDMEFAHGTRLQHFELTKRLGVSNTPVREAIRRLAAEALVETISRRGTVVKKLSTEEVELLYEIRETLEMLAARANEEMLRQIRQSAIDHLKAVKRGDLHEYLDLDWRFHDLIAEGSNNPMLTEMIRTLAVRIHIVRRLTSNPTRDIETGKEHQEIAESLAKRDAEGAAELMQNHIRRHGARVVAMLRNEERTDPGRRQ